MKKSPKKLYYVLNKYSSEDFSHLFHVINLLGQIHEKYKAHYDEMAARILDSNEVPIFMDKNEKIA